MRARSRATAALGCAVALASFAPGRAWADDDEWILGVEPGWSLVTAPGRDARHGGGADLSLWFGVTETTWLFASGGAHVFGGDESLLLGEALGGLVAALDVLRTIPFVEAAGGVVLGRDQVEPVLRLGVGADYLLTSSLALGVVVRYRPLAGLDADRRVSASLRLSWRAELG